MDNGNLAAFERGRREASFLAGLRRMETMNPYPEGTTIYHAYSAGWKAWVDYALWSVTRRERIYHAP